MTLSAHKLLTPLHIPLAKFLEQELLSQRVRLYQMASSGEQELSLLAPELYVA